MIGTPCMRADLTASLRASRRALIILAVRGSMRAFLFLETKVFIVGQEQDGARSAHIHYPDIICQQFIVVLEIVPAPDETPGGGSVMLSGGISDAGVPYTSSWSINP